MASGSLSWSRLLAWVCGRSMGTPTVNSGADTMKMINKTSITSTMGVTLISAMTGRRRWRRLPATAAAPVFSAMSIPSPVPSCHPFVELPRQDGGELVGEPLQALGLLVHVGYEFVIENRRRYGSDKADCGRKQRFGDPWRHHLERGRALLARDRPKARHDAPDGAKQA